MLRYDEIQERLDKGGSYQLEILKLLCEIADTLLYIKDHDKPKEELSLVIRETSKITEDMIAFNEPQPKKRGRPPKG